MSPKTLHDLPAEVLSEIARHVFNFSSSSQRLRKYGVSISAEPSTNRPHLSILLTCRQLYAIAAPILYSQSLFTFSSASTLKSLLTNLRPDTLARLRHVRLWPGYSDDDTWYYSSSEDEGDQAEIMMWTQAISLLPKTLHTLELEIGNDGNLTFFEEAGTHSLMLRALCRLSDLRRLSINCRLGRLPFDYILPGFPRNRATRSNSTPLLPLLQELCLTGRFVHKPAFIAAALSYHNLPQLQTLRLRNGWDKRDIYSEIVSAEALRQVAPLTRLSWTIYEENHREWDSFAAPVQALRGQFTHGHLTVLAERHCRSLRDLNLSLDGTQLGSADIWAFLCNMTQLERLELYLPRNCISLLTSMDSSDNAFLPLLKRLDLTLANEKNLISIRDHVLEFPLSRFSKRVRTVLLDLAIEFTVPFGMDPGPDESVDQWIKQAVGCTHTEACNCPERPKWWDVSLEQLDTDGAFALWLDTTSSRWVKEAESHVTFQTPPNDQQEAESGFLTATP
jgi:hypothetical protein